VGGNNPDLRESAALVLTLVDPLLTQSQALDWWNLQWILVRGI
jgi:hypothetical protein